MKYWKRINETGETVTVESYSHGQKIPGAVPITPEEYKQYIDSLPVRETKPHRNLEQEIDLIWVKLDELHPESLWDKVKKVFTGSKP